MSKVRIRHWQQDGFDIGPYLQFLFRIFMSFLIPFLSLFSILSPSHASQKMELKKDMVQIGKEILDLFPYMSSPQQFKAPKNHELIRQKMMNLQNLFSQSKSHFGFSNRSVSYQFSFENIQDHLQQTIQIFSSYNKDFARTMLKATPSLCISCHVLDKKAKTLFQDVPRSLFASDEEYAEYLYMTRDFKEAYKYFDLHQRQLMANSHSWNEEARNTLRKKVFLQALVLGKEKESMTELQNILDQPQIDTSTKKEIQGMIEGLKEWPQYDKFSPAQGASNGHFTQFQQVLSSKLDQSRPMSLLSSKEEMVYIKLHSLLNDHLRSLPPEQKISKEQRQDLPIILFYLANLERSLNYNMFSTLSDMYLKECMIRFPDHPYAMKCFQEYKDFLTFSFTGSRGTEIPSEIKEELDRLEKIIKKKKTKQPTSKQPTTKK